MQTKNRSIMVNTEIRWGWKDPMITYKRRQKIAKSAYGLVACDYGFEKNSALSKIP